MLKYSSLLFCTLSLYALNDAPWLGDAYGSTFEIGESYSCYRWIDHAKVQPLYSYNNYVTDAAVAWTVAPFLEVELGGDLARTPHQLYGLRSGFVSAKYCLLDDIAGDPLTATVGLDVRAVTGRAVRDVSCPYPSYLNYELFLSFGKEFTKKEEWKSRGFIVGSLGVPNQGSLWNRLEGTLEGRIFEQHIASLFFLGYAGYGKEKEVDVEAFHGWSQVRHTSLDVGVSYRYEFSFWGKLGLSYAYRVLARSYPQNVSTVELRYTLPFSFL